MAASEDQTTPSLGPTPREHVSLLAVLRRRTLVIVLTTILCGAAAAAFAYSDRNSYESTAKLLFRQSIGPELNAVGLDPTSPDADNLAKNNVEVVGSRRVAVATAQELQRRGVDMSADDVEDDVRVTGTNDSEVVEVVASAGSASRAALLANAYSQTVVDLAESDQRRLALRARDEVRDQLEALPARDRKGALGTRLRGDINQLKTLAAVGTGSPQVIQPGYPPSTRSGSPIQTIVLGTLFGLLLGLALALLREQSDRRLHHAEEVSSAFDAPVLTTVPRHRALKRHGSLEELPPQVAEAFRMLQMNLRFAGDQPVRSVLVTSSRTREGKTTVAWYLASAAASAGLSVALVEADMRRASIAQRYELQPEPGLAEVLGGEVSIANALQTVPTQPDVAEANGHAGAMQVLVAGHPPPDPWALMQSSLLVRILDALKMDHDLVIVDTPPIPHVADAISLLRRVDGVVVAASVNSTRGPEAGRLRHQLETLDARVLGVVANRGSAMSGYAYVPARRSGASA